MRAMKYLATSLRGDSGPSLVLTIVGNVARANFKKNAFWKDTTSPAGALEAGGQLSV